MRKNIVLKARAATAAAALLVAAGTTVVAATNASAYTESNKANNCWGRYYNTDWDQLCGSASGAAKTGNYKTTAACSFESDEDMTIYRYQYSTAVVDGEDCTWDVNVGTTTFWD
ncbi:hypothetical protein [Streptomyces sp. NRRL S-237]|uniref:hypothetical protein n=1 Tax=Streptomyces sp. NRRL S-237 TaxID=1463895 RepID=UPI0004C7088D|nr:hypothetical protein [Streptomyces sp. NRRL S-237]